MTDFTFKSAVTEWAEIYEEVSEVDGELSEREIEIAKHFFQWGSMIVGDMIKDEYTNFVVNGRRGCDSYSPAVQEQEQK